MRVLRIDWKWKNEKWVVGGEKLRSRVREAFFIFFDSSSRLRKFMEHNIGR